MMKVSKLLIKDLILFFNSIDYGNWSIPLSEIRLLGEYTNEEGPFVEDHFFVIIDSNNNIFEAPVGAEGIVDVIKALSEIYGCKIELKLIFETSFKSRVIYPQKLYDMDLFTITNKNKISFFKKMINLLKIPTDSVVISENVLNYLDGKNTT